MRIGWSAGWIARAEKDRLIDCRHTAIRERCRNCVLGCGEIQVTRITHVVRVVTKEAMQADVTDIIHVEHRAWAQFPLNADIELQGIRRTVARRQKLGSGVVERIRQSIADQSAIVLGPCREGRLLKCRFDGQCIWPSRSRSAGHIPAWRCSCRCCSFRTVRHGAIPPPLQTS